MIGGFSNLGAMRIKQLLYPTGVILVYTSKRDHALDFRVKKNVFYQFLFTTLEISRNLASRILVPKWYVMINPFCLLMYYSKLVPSS